MPSVRASIGLLLLAVFTSVRADAASTTNYSDQWWIPAESGWGASVLQQWDTLFIDLFVYGTDNKPAWFTVAAYYQANSPAGHALFNGDLYVTSGPYYGGPFNAAPVTARKVGTLSFDATDVNTARLTYVVDGTTVVKNVTRQTWRNENLSGSYYGGIVSDRAGCNTPANNGHGETPANFAITQLPDNSITITAEVGLAGCTITGTYTQTGHMGEITNGHGPCDDNGGGTSFHVYEIERTATGFSARFSAVGDPGGDQCKTAARIGGVRR